MKSSAADRDRRHLPVRSRQRQHPDASPLTLTPTLTPTLTLTPTQYAVADDIPKMLGMGKKTKTK